SGAVGRIRRCCGDRQVGKGANRAPARPVEASIRKSHGGFRGPSRGKQGVAHLQPVGLRRAGPHRARALGRPRHGAGLGRAQAREGARAAATEGRLMVKTEGYLIFRVENGEFENFGLYDTYAAAKERIAGAGLSADWKIAAINCWSQSPDTSRRTR